MSDVSGGQSTTKRKQTSSTTDAEEPRSANQLVRSASAAHYGTMISTKLAPEESPSSSAPSGRPTPAVRQRSRPAGQRAPTDSNPPASAGREEPADNNNSRAFTSDSEEQIRQSDIARLHLAAPQSESQPRQPEAHSSKSNLLPNQPEYQTRPYPKKVLFIVANEFCERFSYYGLRAVLVLYLKNVLGFTDSNSTVIFHLFTTLCYLTPVLGAVLGDSILGKFNTILYLSIVYFLGELLVVASSVLWYQGLAASLCFFLGLLMIGLGTGGIKPCVSALGGDQFRPHEEKWRQGFFSLFYAAINLGSLISMFSVPILRSRFKCVAREDCYPLAFGLPCALMFLAILIFMLTRNQYNIVPLPESNVILAFFRALWLALSRKLSGRTADTAGPGLEALQPIKYSTGSDNTSSSTISVSSFDEELPVRKGDLLAGRLVAGSPGTAPVQTRDDHWLYLALDRFDLKTLEEFRSVLGILLIFVPLPVYWCLYDQQGSLWTLQATRMSGDLLGLTILPDQMSVANPLLLLAAIPVFEVFLYPALSSCQLLTKPLQRMTLGGLLAALAFVSSAGIELSIQSNLPASEPSVGSANLIFVNGLVGCTMLQPTLRSMHTGGNLTSPVTLAAPEGQLRPLHSFSVEVDSSLSAALYGYQLSFQLASDTLRGHNGPQAPMAECPFGTDAPYKLSILPAPEKSVKIVYVEHGNGKITHKTFNETLELPPAGKARVRLIYEAFGSAGEAVKRQFHLSPAAVSSDNSSSAKFDKLLWDGQVSASEHLDLEVPATGERFLLMSSDRSLELRHEQALALRPGTRNLIVAHQRNGTFAQVKFQILQDNKYQISILYQLVPYLLISVSEVMFSITGLEFSYAMAPENMKSVILAAWNLTTAFGNILTVAVESMHLFSNVAYDFLFYASLMVADMILFAVIGHFYKPYNTKSAQTVL